VIRRAGTTYLWVWPENQVLHPFALLYRPGPDGALDLACAFDQAL
jgi:hypothetical protein